MLLPSLIAVSLAVPFYDTPEAAAPVITPFALSDVDGDRVVVGAERAFGSVLFFADPQGEVSRQRAALYAEMSSTYAEEGFAFFVVDANGSSATQVGEFAAEFELDCPVLLDPLHKAATELGITHNGQAVVLDAGLRLCYVGSAGEPLGDALEALLMEADCESSEDPRGTPLRSIFEERPESVPTFHADVAPLLKQYCVECHRKGQIGPMSLVDVEDVRGWAPMVAEVVAEGRMPPWNANPAVGEFRNDPDMTDAERVILVRWALGGAPKGVASSDRKPYVEPATEWGIETPDLVIEIPEQQVPAEGTIAYRYIEIDPGFTEDRWVQAIEVLPGNRKVLHHIIAFEMGPQDTKQQFFSNPNGNLGDGMFAGYAPGSRPEIYDLGQGVKIKKGTRFLFELHYTATGEPATDRSRLGIRYAREPVEREVAGFSAMTYRLDIQPGDPAATYTARRSIRRPMQLLSMTPHMHSRGKAFRYDLLRDGVRRTLLDVPAYDFNWQHTYYLSEPLRLEPGDVVECTAVFDNSEANPSNPDPTAQVRWGEQTWEEMMIGFMSYVEAD